MIKVAILLLIVAIITGSALYFFGFIGGPPGNPACIIDSDCDDGIDNTVGTCLDSGIILPNNTYGAYCFYRLGAIGNVKVAILEFGQPGLKYGKNINYCIEEECFPTNDLQWNENCGPDNSLCSYIEEYDYISVLNSETEKEKITKATFIDYLGNEKPNKHYSLYYIEDWFKSEANTYGADVDIDIDVFGPYETDILPPKRGANDNCGEVLQPYFDKQVLEQGLDLSNYDIINYIYFTDMETGDAFWSCGYPHAYISHSGVDGGINDQGRFTILMQTIMHEMAHKFGATDAYDGFACKYPEGFFEPDKNPLYPQSKACLMCGKMPIISHEMESFAQPLLLEEITVCSEAAKEIGWK